MKTTLEAIETVGKVDVRRTGPDSSDGYTWFITFATFSGDVSPLSVGTSSLTGQNVEVYVDEVRKGSLTPEVQDLSIDLTGVTSNTQIKFKFGTASTLSKQLSTLDDDEVKNLLDSLSTIGFVQLSSNHDTSFKRWSVTFLTERGHLCPPLVAEVGGTQVSATTTNETWPVNGTFRLNFRNTFTNSLAFNASREEVTQALVSICSDCGFTVSRNDAESYVQSIYSWSITFKGSPEDMDMMYADSTLMKYGDDEVILNVEEIQKGMLSFLPSNTLTRTTTISRCEGRTVCSSDSKFMLNSFTQISRGTNVALRVFASNQNGAGPFNMIYPFVFSPRPVTPSALTVASRSDAKALIRVNHDAPLHSSYKVHWYSGNITEVEHVIQSLTIFTNKSDNSIYSGGMFRVRKLGSTIYSPYVDYNCSAQVLENALNSISIMNPVSVTKGGVTTDSRTWNITFISDFSDISILDVDTGNLVGNSSVDTQKVRTWSEPNLFGSTSALAQGQKETQVIMIQGDVSNLYEVQNITLTPGLFSNVVQEVQQINVTTTNQRFKLHGGYINFDGYLNVTKGSSTIDVLKKRSPFSPKILNLSYIKIEGSLYEIVNISDTEITISPSYSGETSAFARAKFMDESNWIENPENDLASKLSSISWIGNISVTSSTVSGQIVLYNVTFLRSNNSLDHYGAQPLLQSVNDSISISKVIEATVSISGSFALSIGDYTTRLEGNVTIDTGGASVLSSVNFQDIISMNETLVINQQYCTVKNITSVTSAGKKVSRLFCFEVLNTPTCSGEGCSYGVYVKPKTIDIPYNASAQLVETALRNLDSINEVKVRVHDTTQTTSNQEYYHDPLIRTWEISFKRGQSYQSGNSFHIEVFEDDLIGTNPANTRYTGVSYNSERQVTTGIKGLVALSLNGNHSKLFNVSANSSVIQAAIEQMCGHTNHLESVVIERSDAFNVTWLVTFADKKEYPLLSVIDRHLFADDLRIS
eukprot:g937.t1